MEGLLSIFVRGLLLPLTMLAIANHNGRKTRRNHNTSFIHLDATFGSSGCGSKINPLVVIFWDFLPALSRSMYPDQVQIMSPLRITRYVIQDYVGFAATPL